MPAKNRAPKKRKPLSLHSRVAGYMDAQKQCSYWAQKVIELEVGGRHAAANKAREKARSFMAKMIELEVRLSD